MVRFTDVVLFSLSPASALVLHDIHNDSKWLPLKGIRNHDRWAFTNVELDTYLKIGTPQIKRLKKKFQNSTVIGHLVRETCGPPQPEMDRDGSWNCDWQELDTLLCETTLKAGRMGMLGDVEELKAAIIEEKADLEWAEAVGPSWLGEYRLREQSSSDFDKMMMDLNQNASTHFDAETMQGLEDICVTAKTSNTTCRKTTLRHILCQKVEQAAARLLTNVKLLPILEKATEPNGDAEQILRSAEKLRPRPEEMFRTGAYLTQPMWLNNGPNSSRTLKRRFLDTPGVYHLLDDMCVNNEETDCHWKYSDKLLCHMLQRFEPDDPTGELLQRLEDYILKNVKSDKTDGNDGLDWGFRSAMIAKWRLNMGLMPAGGPIGEMKNRVINSEDFQSMMQPICWDVYFNRPGCWQSAPQSLFCQGLVQATGAVSNENVEHFLTWVKSQVSCFAPDFAEALGSNFLRPFKYDGDGCQA